MNEQKFLELWKEARELYLSKPTFIPRLKSYEASLLRVAIEDFGEDGLKIAINGLFKQKNKSLATMFLSPSHFLDNVDKYYNAEMCEEYSLYGESKKSFEADENYHKKVFNSDIASNWNQ